MLNHSLKKTQPGSVEIRDCAGPVKETGFPPSDSANLGVRRLAKTRAQRMRRRSLRATTGFSAGGWVARML